MRVWSKCKIHEQSQRYDKKSMQGHMGLKEDFPEFMLGIGT